MDTNARALFISRELQIWVPDYSISASLGQWGPSDHTQTIASDRHIASAAMAG